MKRDAGSAMDSSCNLALGVRCLLRPSVTSQENGGMQPVSRLDEQQFLLKVEMDPVEAMVGISELRKARGRRPVPGPFVDVH